MYQSFVGLEIHIQLLTTTKAFCACRASFGDQPNTNICPVCMGYPGVLPALNAEAIRMGFLVARTLNCTLNRKTFFDRKNYFYPDMPKNYQISQLRSPVGVNGWIEFEFRKRKKKVRINDVHLEEDAGKMIHAGDMSLLDYNRAGTPLLEIVTMPDLEAGEEAEAFLLYFRRLVRYLGVCDGNMEEGSLRCDVNVSINLPDKGLGTKVEIKNLNSSRFVKKALAFEIERQKEILDRSGTIRQETRLWNENRDVTEVMRVKETESDYRYFPEPDLPPFNADDAFISAVEQRLVEQPRARLERLVAAYRLPEAQADLICEEKETADYFEETIALGADPHTACLWLTSDVRKHLNRTGKREHESPLTPARFAEMLALIANNKIHGKIAKQVLEVVFNEDRSPAEIIRERGWEQITTREEILPFVRRALAENPEAVKQVKEAGDAKPITFLIGKIMTATGGRAEPRIASQVLEEELALHSIHVLLMGGAITARRTDTGVVVPGDVRTIRKLFEGIRKDESSIRIEELDISSILSEEITPADWAGLISKIAALTERQTSRGIVITHGTDTLAYTASLVYWLFCATPVPIVFVASMFSPSGDREEEFARKEIELAIHTACGSRPGVYVVCGGKILSPLNLRFERIGAAGFRNWNTNTPVHSGMPVKTFTGLQDADALVQKIEKIVEKVCVLKVYPGIRSDFISNIVSRRFMHVILELYGSGTANTSDSAYSVRRAIAEGRDRLVAFYCTSQQESAVDFADYSTSRELWQEGAIPMGALATESAYTKLIACLLATDSDEEAARLMESGTREIGG